MNLNTPPVRFSVAVLLLGLLSPMSNAAVVTAPFSDYADDHVESGRQIADRTSGASKSGGGNVMANEPRAASGSESHRNTNPPAIARPLTIPNVTSDWMLGLSLGETNGDLTGPLFGDGTPAGIPGLSDSPLGIDVPGDLVVDLSDVQSVLILDNPLKQNATPSRAYSGPETGHSFMPHLMPHLQPAISGDISSGPGGSAGDWLLLVPEPIVPGRP